MQDVMGIPVVEDPSIPPDSFRLEHRDQRTLPLNGERVLDPPRFEHEHKTVWLFGKPYYWAVKRDGGYVLCKGYSLEDIEKRRVEQ